VHPLSKELQEKASLPISQRSLHWYVLMPVLRSVSMARHSHCSLFALQPVSLVCQVLQSARHLPFHQYANCWV
jgi:hypothetical protein